MKKQILPRTPNRAAYLSALEQGLSDLQAKIIANRCDEGRPNKNIIKPSLNVIAPPWQLQDAVKAAQRLAEAIGKKQTIGILTDYDVDGITSHAIIFYALTEFFSVEPGQIRSYIGHRVEDGYGVSNGLVNKILSNLELPNIIITADCGSSDEERIRRLKEAKIDVIVTDHHAIPAEGIPGSADAVINPTRKDCNYPDSSIAGCMVAWLLMSQLRIELIKLNYLPSDSPKLSSLLDFVSLGTVADAVSLFSSINRAVVSSGLSIMNGFNRFAWQAMIQMLNKSSFNVEDLGFQIGPRINARSRMADPYQALDYLTACDIKQANQTLAVLNQDNIERREIEKEMLLEARQMAIQYSQKFKHTLVIYSANFHPGVQGIVASRLVDEFGRPAIVFSPSADNEQISASARTIPQIDIRSILQQIADTHKQLLTSFGGHKGAAGLKINKSQLALFQDSFEKTVNKVLGLDTILYPILYSDGELTSAQLSYATIEELELLEPYGRGFEAPVFNNRFEILSLRCLGSDGQHISMNLKYQRKNIRAIWFNAIKPGEIQPFVPGQQINAAYRLIPDDYRGVGNFQLNIQYAENN